MAANKDIYILGAGASVSAGLPIQSQIIKGIFELRQNDVDSIANLTFMDTDDISLLIPGAYINFCKFRFDLAIFIIALFGSKSDKNKMDFISNSIDSNDVINEDDLSAIFNIIVGYNITLEDVFTFFDKSYITTEYFREFSDSDLSRYHNALKSCIIFVISLNTIRGQKHSIYSEFAHYLVDKRLCASQSDDSFAIISMNWDTLLDYSLHHECLKREDINKKNRNNISIDYCCYDMNLDGGMPSVHIKARNRYNIKLMKVHGSTNWLVCSNCGRLFTHHTSNIAIGNLYGSTGQSDIKCVSCAKNMMNYQLRPVIITPTFMKSLDSVPLKNIWHNASLDLADANTVYFIGYSFPEADFELKYILKKYINRHTTIKVVLHESDSPQFYSEKMRKLSNKSKSIIQSKLGLPESRYRSFFSSNEIEFNYSGFEAALKNKFIL